MRSHLLIVGSPLNDLSPLSPETIDDIQACRLIIGESRKRTLSLLAKSGIRLGLESFIFLDHPDFQSLKQIIRDIAKGGGNIALLSDSGMPILFDPGKEVLELCKQLGFAIRTRPTATSWSTACAVSGFSTPFLIHDFLPQKTPDRAKILTSLKNREENIVLLETPYRFQLILKEAIDTFGKDRQAFIAWQIACIDEWYGWGTLSSLLEISVKTLPKKGEFVLIIHHS